MRQFESEFAEYCGVAAAVGVASGSDALQIALRALEIGPGDEVITVSHTAVASVAAIELVGARPILADIDARRYTLDPERLKGYGSLQFLSYQEPGGFWRRRRGHHQRSCPGGTHAPAAPAWLADALCQQPQRGKQPPG
jgi:hypothetical protein